MQAPVQVQRYSPTGVFLSKMVTARLRPGTMSKSELNEFIEAQTNCNCRSQSRYDVVVLNVPADLVPAQRCRPKCVSKWQFLAAVQVQRCISK